VHRHRRCIQRKHRIWVRWYPAATLSQLCHYVSPDPKMSSIVYLLPIVDDCLHLIGFRNQTAVVTIQTIGPSHDHQPTACGYGVDQMYLWYKRDGAKFEHQVHLLAFITADFERMQSNMFAKYGKPVIDIENGTLVVKNVPVPRLYGLSWLTYNAFSILRHLRTVEFVMRVGRKLRFAPDNTRPMEKKRNERTQEVLRKIFEDLKPLTRNIPGSRYSVDQCSQHISIVVATKPRSKHVHTGRTTQLPVCCWSSQRSGQ
jgi:hypothetical protein